MEGGARLSRRRRVPRVLGYQEVVSRYVACGKRPKALHTAVDDRFPLEGCSRFSRPLGDRRLGLPGGLFTYRGVEAASARAARDFAIARTVTASPSDRMSTGLMSRRRSAAWADRACTIPRNWTKTSNAMRAAALGPRAASDHPISQRRPQPPVESPGTWTCAGLDETRNSDQRQSARDAGRHHRGRPAR